MEILRIKELLSLSGINGKILADKTGVSQNTISNIVSGKNFPKPELLLKISEVLDVDVRDLFNSTKKTDNVLLGHIEFNGEVHKILTINDLETLLKKVKETQ